MNAGSLTVRLTLDDGQFKASLKNADGSVREFGAAGKQQGKKAASGFQFASAAAVAMGTVVAQAAMKVISKVVDLSGEIMTASDSMEKFAGTMGFAGFDDTQIKNASRVMKTYADQTVFGLNDVMNTTAQLAANGTKDYIGLTQAAGNLTAVAGGGADAFKSVAMMLTQTAGAGKLTTENWNQLTDAIPGASGRLQQAMLEAGAYTGNFRDAMAKGEVTAAEFNEAIMKLGSEPVAVEAASSTKTFEGSLGNLGATAVDVGTKVIDGIGKDNITSAIDTITSVVEDFGNKLSEVIPQVIDTFEDGYDWFVKWKDVIVLIAAPVLAAYGAFVLWKGAIEAWRIATTIATAAQTAFNIVLNANPIMIIVMAIAALVAGLVYFFTQTEAGKAVWQSFTNFMGKAWESITGFFAKAWNIIVSIWGTVTGFFGGVWNGIKSIFSGVGGWFSGIFQGALNGVKNIWNGIGDFFRGIPGKISDALGDLGSIGSDLVEGLWNGINNMGDWIGDKIRGFGEGITNQLKDFFGIHSPSRRMRDEIGKMLGFGVGDGIVESMGAVMRSIDTFSEGMMDKIGGSISKVIDIGYSYASVDVPTMGAEDIYGYDGSTGGAGAPTIVQNNYPTSEVDMNIINRSLVREARRA